MIEKSVSFQNKNIFYKITGKGEPVLLIHGFAEDSDLWRYQVQDLSQKYLLIIPDLPGSGKSEIIDDMSIEGMADCVKQIINAELISTISADKSLPATGITMIGHSMGGYITLAFAEKYAVLLRGIGLFHSTAFADSDEKKAVRQRGIEFMQKHGSYEFVKQSAPNLFTPEYVSKSGNIVHNMIARYGGFDPAVLIACYRAMIQRPDRTNLLRNFDKPILFIIGKNDKAIPFEDSMKQCHLPQLAFIHILENTAHMGMWEQKEKSTQILLSFLQDATV